MQKKIMNPQMSDRLLFLRSFSSHDIGCLETISEGSDENIDGLTFL